MNSGFDLIGENVVESNDFFNQSRGLIKNKILVYDTDLGFIEYMWKNIKSFNIDCKFIKEPEGITSNKELDMYDIFIINYDSLGSSRIIEYLAQEKLKHTYEAIITVNKDTVQKHMIILEKGFNYIFEKPISFEYLKFIVRNIIETRNQYTLRAYIDELTGVPNRKYLLRKLGNINKNNAFLAIVDLDKFKDVNDTYGHNAGDKVLKRFAYMAKTTFKNDIVVRWGGEEFAILFISVKGLNEAFNNLNNFREFFGKMKILIEGKTAIHQTFSAGIVRLGDRNIKEATEEADKLLYEAKESGRNKVICGDCFIN